MRVKSIGTPTFPPLDLVKSSRILISKQFSFIVALVWLIGCIPIKFTHLFPNTTKQVPEKQPPFYKNPVLFYSLVFFIFRSMIVAFTAYDWLARLESTSLSSFIVNNLDFSIFICWVFADFMRRIYLLSHPTLIIQTFNSLRKFTNNYEKKVVGNQRPHNLANIAKGLGLFIYLYDCFLRTFLWLRNGHIPFWTEVGCHVIRITSDNALSFFEIELTIFFGVHCIEIYRKIVVGDLLEDNYPPEKVLKNFKHVKQMLHYFNKLVGFLILTNVVQNSLSAIYEIYLFIELWLKGSRKAMAWAVMLLYISTGIHNLFTIYVLVHFGEYTQNVIEMAKNKIKDALVESRVILPKWADKTYRERSAVAKYILEYKWNLTACGLFDVDYKLLMMLAGTSMTYVVVVLQLKISESSTATSAAVTAAATAASNISAAASAATIMAMNSTN